MNPYVPYVAPDNFWWAEPAYYDAGGTYAGADLPWWIAVPAAPPLALGKWLGERFHLPSGFSGSGGSSSSPPPMEVPWLGIAAMLGVGALLVYGISRASNAAERIGGPIQERTGRLVGNMLSARAASGKGAASSKGVASGNGATSSRGTYGGFGRIPSRSLVGKPSNGKVIEGKLLSALPEYESYG